MRFLSLHISIAILATTNLASDGAAQNGNSWQSANSSEKRYGDTSGGLPTAGQSTPGGSTQSITPIGRNDQVRAAAATSGAAELAPIRTAAQRAVVTDISLNNLFQSQGQVCRAYDISPYTLRATTINRPEQMIVDWILRETGYEAWHTEPAGLLTATRKTLRVCHTPEMHALVKDIVDRFVNTQADQSAFSLRIATVRNPNWRAKALPLMTPIPVQSPGVQGWLLAREDAALLLSELARRTDYREYNSAAHLIHNGQLTVVSTMRPRSYVKGIVPTGAAWPGYQPEMGQLEEGFALEFSPLLSLDLSSADAVVKLRLNQVEKMLPVKLDMPTVVTPNQRVQVEVPQMTTANLHERFRWPTDKVLLLSMGVVATPDPGVRNPLTDAVPLLKSPPRADALLMVECRSKLAPASSIPTTVRTATLPRHTFQGRY